MGDSLPLSNLVKKAVADAGRGARRRKRLDKFRAADKEKQKGKEEATTPPQCGNRTENGADALSVLAKQAWEERRGQSHNTVGLAFVPSYIHAH